MISARKRQQQWRWKRQRQRKLVTASCMQGGNGSRKWQKKNHQNASTRDDRSIVSFKLQPVTWRSGQLEQKWLIEQLQKKIRPSLGKLSRNHSVGFLWVVTSWHYCLSIRGRTTRPEHDNQITSNRMLKTTWFRRFFNKLARKRCIDMTWSGSAIYLLS